MIRGLDRHRAGKTSRRQIVALLALAALTSLLAGAGGEGGRLSVLTYNVAGLPEPPVTATPVAG